MTVSTYRLTIAFSGVDFADEDVYEALSVLDDVVWNSRDSVAYAMSRVEAPSALAAASSVATRVCALVSSARPLRLDEDLVSIPDIAARVGVSREAVRNWVNGSRRTGSFPAPTGIIGDGIKIWPWRHVNHWLRVNLTLGDIESFPTDKEAAQIHLMFDQWCASASKLNLTVWKVCALECEELIAERPSMTRSRRPISWIPSSGKQAESSVIPRQLRVG
jgi:hypothetical protein